VSAAENQLRSPFMMLLVDCDDPKSRGDLSGWLGAENAELVWGHRRRYTTILSVDQGGDPRYHHTIECVSTIEDALSFIDSTMEVVSQLGSPLFGGDSFGFLDMRYRLNPNDRAWIDAKLDSRNEVALREISPTGAA
jgi:hypothetical protein